MKTLKKAASRIEDKHGERYPEIMATIKQKLRFSILSYFSAQPTRGPYDDLIHTSPCLVAALHRFTPEVPSGLCSLLLFAGSSGKGQRVLLIIRTKHGFVRPRPDARGRRGTYASSQGRKRHYRQVPEPPQVDTRG
eukprot:sb/3474673/